MLPGVAFHVYRDRFHSVNRLHKVQILCLFIFIQIKVVAKKILWFQNVFVILGNQDKERN